MFSGGIKDIGLLIRGKAWKRKGGNLALREISVSTHFPQSLVDGKPIVL